MDRRKFLENLGFMLFGAGVAGITGKNLFREPKSEKTSNTIDYNGLESDLIRHEEERTWVYDDATGKRLFPGDKAKGNPTIGVGFNLNRADARERIKSQGLDYQLVYSGNQNITSEHSRIWLKEDIAQAERDAIQYLGKDNYDRLDGEAKAIITNMSFNLGPNRLSKFVKLKEALISQDYSRAAQEMKDSQWYEQTGNRAKELTERMSKLD